ncbi:formimidoylglutamate deiminase [Sphingomonas oryzagri]
MSSAARLHFEHAMLPDGWGRDVTVTVSDGLIARIERGTAPAPGDDAHKIGLPGLPNLHSHAFQRGMAGLAERRGAGDDSFWTWREVMYRFVERMGPDEMRAIAGLAYVEMLESGFTRVGEFHYVHHAPDGTPYANPAEMAAALAGAAEETGIALTLLPVFYAHAGFGGQAAGEDQRRFVHDIDSFARLRARSAEILAALPDAVIGLAPHSLRAVTPDELAALVAMAERQAPIHIHVAEQQREVRDCLAWSGARPVEWLLDHSPVDQRWCLVHATHMTGAETAEMARSTAVAGLCPITEANLGDGLFPVRDFLAAGGTYGVGSDSNVLIDAAEEMRLLEYGQRLQCQSRNMLATEAGGSTGGAIVRAALTGGGQALGTRSALMEGCAADLVSLDADHPAFIARERDAWLDGWIFAARRGAVDAVWRRGRKIVSGGRHHARDAIVARYRAALAGLFG